MRIPILTGALVLPSFIAALAAAQPRFRNVTAESGFLSIQGYGGHGIQVADIDGDGLLDVYVTHIFDPKQNRPDLLFRNLGGSPPRFEEIGLAAEAVCPLGYLDPYLSATGFLVTPVIGLVDPEAGFRPNPDEVAEIFEVPLGFLMEAARYELRSREWQGRIRYFYALPFGERLIWGVTAGILHNLRERLAR